MKMNELGCALGFGVAMMMLVGASASQAQVPLSAYADKDGFIDVQALTCAQLAGTFQEDADMLAAWYSGWYNGLAKKHFAHIERVKPGEHLVIRYCRPASSRTASSLFDGCPNNFKRIDRDQHPEVEAINPVAA